MYKIALVAGHFLGTPGKRIPKALDPKETREWTLNDRVCDKIEKLLTGYTGYELLRIDDTTGKTNITLQERVRKANEWGANVWVEPHHNALNGKPWSGGGIEVYAHPNASEESREMQKQLYDALIAKTGLKGNRSSPVQTANFYTLRNTSMPAVLLELGFMDSTVDAPIILTEEYTDKCAAAIVEVMVKRGGLKKKATAASSSGSSSSKKTFTVELETLRPGDIGPQVVWLQRYLIGYGGKPAEIILSSGGADGKYYTKTKEAVEAFQSENVDENGKPLTVDGIAGPDTFGAMFEF